MSRALVLSLYSFVLTQLMSATQVESIQSLSKLESREEVISELPVVTTEEVPVSSKYPDPESYELATRTNSRIVSIVSTAPSETPIVRDEKAERRTEYLCLLALLWPLFVEGWNDGTSGPLIPAMQRHYNIGFAIVSLIFVLNTIGFVSGAVANIYLTHKIGFGATLVIGAVLQSIAYCIQAPAPPFPLFAIAYCFSGFGLALQNAQATVFAISLNKNSSTKMGILQAAYGVGALISPLSATRFANEKHWSFHFFTSLGLAIINVALLIRVFRFQPLNVVLTKAGQKLHEQVSSQDNHFKQIWKLKVVHLISMFVLVYVGVEVTIGGWIVTFVLDKRGGGSSSGYLTSGFFGGLTLGRVGLLWLNKKVGERRVMWLYMLLIISLEITIWLVPSLIGNAIAVSFIGLFMGPIYPIVMNIVGRLIPHWLLSGSIGWIAGIGQTGSALLPFITGAMASRFGVMSLQPLLVSVMGVMVCLWAVVPREMHRSE